MVLLLVGCIYRLMWIDAQEGDPLRGRADVQQHRQTTYTARRGSILDSNPGRPEQHNVLAASFLADSVFVDPLLIDDPRMVVDLLARTLDLPADQRTELLDDILRRRSGPMQSSPRLYPWQMRDLTDAERRFLAEQAVPRSVGELTPEQIDALLATMPVPARRLVWVKRLLDRDQSHRLRELRASRSCYLNPVKVRKPRPVVDGLAGILQLDAARRAELLAEIDRRRNLDRGHPDRTHLWVARMLGAETVDRIRTLRREQKLDGIGLENELLGVGLEQELKREYPSGPLAAHLLGYVGAFGEGLEGIENRFNETLSGTDGSKQVVADVRGRPIWSGQGDYKTPEDGHSIVLTINAVVQSIAEQALYRACGEYEAESGVAVVMDPQTGAILAMANAPNFSPADYAAAPPDFRRNRCLTDPFEPGSIFKWAVIAGAIDKGVVRETDRFNAHQGEWNYNGRVIHDSHGYGMLTVRQAVTKSSNIVMAQIALKMGQQNLYDTLHDFGFGQRTGIELSGAEAPGLLYPVNRWTSYSVPSLSFGQEVTVTAVQMVRAFSAVANGGRLLTPRLVLAVVDDSQKVMGGPVKVVHDYSPEALRAAGQWQEKRIMTERTSRTMIDILTETVDEGTGRRAKIPDLKVFGKTGTAQIADGETGRYLENQYTASFIGGAPSERPRLVVLVSIRKPNPAKSYFGGTVAAPAVREIIGRALPFLGEHPAGGRHAAQ